MEFGFTNILKVLFFSQHFEDTFYYLLAYILLLRSLLPSGYCFFVVNALLCFLFDFWFQQFHYGVLNLDLFLLILPDHYIFSIGLVKFVMNWQLSSILSLHSFLLELLLGIHRGFIFPFSIFHSFIFFSHHILLWLKSPDPPSNSFIIFSPSFNIFPLSFYFWRLHFHFYLAHFKTWLFCFHDALCMF